METKKILPITVLFLALGFSQVSAQKSTNITTKTQVINASADDVWGRVRKLDGLEVIMPEFLADSWVIDNAEPGVGAKRSCSAPGQPKGQASYTEQVVEFDDGARYYKYVVVQGLPAKNIVNTFRVVDLGYKKCMAVWTSDMEEFMQNPQMTKEQFVGFVDSAGDALMSGLVKLHDGK